MSAERQLADADDSSWNYRPKLSDLAPFAGLFYLSLLVLALPHTHFDLDDAGVVSCAILGTVLFVMVGLIPWNRLPGWLDAAGPLAFFAIIGGLRVSTGGAESPLTAIVLLPGVWLALRGTRGQMLCGVLATFAVFAVPYLVVGAPRYDLDELGRGLLWASVALVTGLAIQAILRRERGYLDHLAAMHHAQQRLAEQVQDTSFGLRKEQQLNRMVLDNIDIGVIACDADGLITLANEPILRLLYPGHPTPLLRAAQLPSPIAADSSNSTVNALELALTGEVFRDRERMIIVPGTGEAIWVSSNGGPLLDSDGVITGAVLAVRDITPKREAQSELQRARDGLARLLDAVTEQAIIGTDADGVVTLFNPGAERMLGQSEAEVLGQTTLASWTDPIELKARLAELELPADSASEHAMIAGALASGSDTRNWTLVRPDGRRIDAAFSVTVVRDEDAEVSGYLGVVSDITAQRAAEKLKDQFVAMVSHELRTPLSSIIGYLELLLDDPKAAALDPAHARYLTVVDRNARRLMRLVGDLLFAAQVGAGSVLIRRGPADLAAVLTQSVDSAEPKARATGIDLSIQLDADLPAWHIDADRIGQAVDNVIGNALKFTPRDGWVAVRLDVDDDGAAVIEVSDSGPGIPPEDQVGIFETFFRARTAREAAVPGIGLGLTIARAICAAHEGTLDLVASGPGGTTFRLVLPPG